jgi:hypothetical protein
MALLLTGLSLTSLLQSPRTAHSQTDYEEYVILESINQQGVNQQNIGSGSSTNINCGTNIAGTNLARPITACPDIPGETSGKPVVTQRSAEVPANPSGTTSAEAQCNPEEVVTGGGYELSEQRRSGGSGGGGGNLPPVVFINTSFKEFVMNNAWHIEIVNPDLTGTVKVHAECLKLVPE